jgi:hypothetical protein
MALECEINPIRGRIGLVDPDGQPLVLAQPGDQRRGESLVLVVDHADMPGAPNAGIDRREGMHRDQARLTAAGDPLVDQFPDGGVIGFVSQRCATRLLVRRKIGIAGDHGGLADRGDQIRRVQRPVAIDHQPRNAGFHQGRIEHARHMAADRGRARIPGDVPQQVRLFEPKGREFNRNVVGRVVADEQIAAGAGAVGDPRRAVCLASSTLQPLHRAPAAL